MIRRCVAGAALFAVAVIPTQRLLSQTDTAAPRVNGSSRVAPPTRPPATMTAADVERDLNALQSELKNRWKAPQASGDDYRTAIASLRTRGANGMARTEFSVEVFRIVSTFVEGHAGVRGVEFPPGDLPFYLESSGDRVVAVRIDRVSLVDPYRPYITRIDGRPIADWLSAAESLVPNASPQWTRRSALAHVQRIQFMRGVLGLPTPNTVVIEVATRDGRTRRDVTLEVSSRSTGSVVWPSSASRVIRGDIGYLRIPLMDEHAVSEIATWMAEFRDTRGLIIDVRGNGGGSCAALRALFPYFMSATDTSRIVNPARYRVHPSDDASFTLSRRMNPNAYEYDKPVVILMDEGSFSATDIFVAAFKGWRNVTLIGTPSGGGSARYPGVTLPVSRLSVMLASTVSFQLDGKLIDSDGTEPDVLVHPDPDYFLARGWDAALERAVDQVRRN